jgi:hypothetical protein
MLGEPAGEVGITSHGGMGIQAVRLRRLCCGDSDGAELGHGADATSVPPSNGDDRASCR